MQKNTAARRPLRLPIVLAVAAAFMPLEPDPAEAVRIKVRLRSNSDSSSGLNSYFAKRTDDRKARTFAPGTAAAAAERARVALDAEKSAQQGGAAHATAQAQPAVGGKTVGYANGVTCVAGC